MNLDSLVEITNTLLRMERPSPRDLQFALRTACDELTDVVQSPEFFQLIERAEQNKKYEPKQLREIFDDMAEFEKFVEVETRIFKERGLEVRSANALLKAARELRGHIRDRGEYEQIRAGMFEVRDETCKMADELGVDPSVAVESRARVRRILRRVGTVIGGVTVVGLNGWAEATMGQLYAHASVDFGVALVVAGIGIKD